MATIDVVNLGGEKVGSFELADEVFGAVNEDLLWEAVKHYRAGQRAGTHATKNKKLVSGAGKKLWKQNNCLCRHCWLASKFGLKKCVKTTPLKPLFNSAWPKRPSPKRKQA